MPPSPLARKLGELDAEMKSILDRTDLDEYEKAVQYSQVLEKYISVKQKMLRPTQIPIIDQNPQPSVKPAIPAPVITNKPNVDLEQFPTQYRNRAQNLLKHIENQTDIHWNDRGELLVDGTPFAGSHIVDLIDDTVRHKKTARPPGSESFMNALLNSNVPRTLVGNKPRLILPYDNTPPPSPLAAARNENPTPSPRGHSSRGRGKGNKHQVGNGLMKWAHL